MSLNIINEMIGKTFSRVIAESDEMNFYDENGELFVKFYHEQDCCECVSIEDICGDLYDLVGSPIVVAEEINNVDEPPLSYGYHESYTWTYYRFATNKGWVTVRWYGTSNGYYSESVNYEFFKQ